MPDSRSSPTVLHDALAPEVRTDRLRPGWLVGMKAFDGTTTYRFMELNRPEQALDFYERALKPASAVPEPNFGTFSPESAVGLHSYLGASVVRRIPHGRPRRQPSNVVVMSYRGFAGQNRSRLFNLTNQSPPAIA